MENQIRVKSTLLNTLVGYNRSQTSSLAGTTSDTVIDYINFNDHKIKFIDTAGIGRKSNIIDKSMNYLAVKKSLESMSKFDFSLILIDSHKGIDRQDKRLIKLISEKSKGILLIFNKFDLIQNKSNYKSDTIIDISNSLSEVKNIKIFFISALDINNKLKILNYILDNYFLKYNNISTSKLNIWLKKTVLLKSHPLIEGKKVNFKYAVQVKDKPVIIKIFCSYSDKLKSDYKRYLTNNFNNHFKILNQKTKIIFSSSKNPFV